LGKPVLVSHRKNRPPLRAKFIRSYKMKKRITIICIVVLVIINAFTLLIVRKKNLSLAKPPKTLVVRIDTVKLTKSKIELTLPVLAQVKSEDNVTVSTKITGNITKIFKKEGDIVKKGELLATIDRRELVAKKSALKLKNENLDYEISSKKSELESLKINLKNLNGKHDRTRELLNVKGASIEQFQNEESIIASLKTKIKASGNGLKALGNQKEIITQNLKEINSTISYTFIKSPVDGIVGEKFASEGELALPGKPLFSVTTDTGKYLVTHLPSDIEPTALKIDNTSIPLTDLNITDKNGLREYRTNVLKRVDYIEGEIVNANLVVYSGTNVKIPHEAILSREGKNLVFIYEDGKVSPVQIHILNSGQEGTVVDVSLDGKTLVLAKPDILLRLLTGVQVKLIET